MPHPRRMTNMNGTSTPYAAGDEARGRRWRSAAGRSGAHGEGVLAADAVAEAGDVGAVDVHGDGHGVTGIADAVDVAGRREAVHGPCRVHVTGGEPERANAVGQGEDLLVLAPLQYAGD